jgi:uncharacterized Zn finger protein
MEKECKCGKAAVTTYKLNRYMDVENSIMHNLPNNENFTFQCKSCGEIYATMKKTDIKIFTTIVTQSPKDIQEFLKEIE